MLHQRFKEARLALDYSQEQLAEITQVTQTSIYKIEAALTVNPRKLKVFADALEVTEEWLRYGITNATRDTTQPVSSGSNATLLKVQVGSVDAGTEGLGLDTSELGAAKQPAFVSIPVYDVYFSAGDGCFFENAEIIAHYSICVDTLEHYNVSEANATVVKVKGESMEYTLNNGDTILVDRSIKKPTNNKIFAFSFDGELKVKRFFHQLDKSWRVSSDNEDKNRYKDEFISPQNVEALDMVGQVLTILDRSLI